MYVYTYVDDCLGSYCDVLFQPPKCSPKVLKQAIQTGAHFFSDPYEP
jgi:hypothetical protein